MRDFVVAHFSRHLALKRKFVHIAPLSSCNWNELKSRVRNHQYNSLAAGAVAVDK